MLMRSWANLKSNELVMCFKHNTNDEGCNSRFNNLFFNVCCVIKCDHHSMHLHFNYKHISKCLKLVPLSYCKNLKSYLFISKQGVQWIWCSSWNIHWPRYKIPWEVLNFLWQNINQSSYDFIRPSWNKWISWTNGVDVEKRFTKLWVSKRPN